MTLLLKTHKPDAQFVELPVIANDLRLLRKHSDGGHSNETLKNNGSVQSGRYRTITSGRLRYAKRSFVTRNMDLSNAKYLKKGEVTPKAGDLVLCKVTALGQHKRIELINGRRAFLHVEDEIILSYGARYAADQFEGHVPDSLVDCYMVAAGGIAATFECKNASVRNPTKIRPIGLLCDKDRSVLNLASGVNLAEVNSASSVPPSVIAVVGSGMNAGKTTVASRIIHGLTRENMNVAAIKITGTGSGGDLWQYGDAGAAEVLDFTDAGFASTYLISETECQNIAENLIAHALRNRPDVIVLEVADGLLQRETYKILKSNWFRDMVDTLVYAACDGLSAKAGVSLLQELELPVKAVGGRLTSAPLCQWETASVTNLPILDNPVFEDTGCLAQILFSADY